MTTPYTLMRCRVRDMISCFNACKVDESAHRKPKTSAIANDRNPEREKKQVKDETQTAAVVKGGKELESPASWQSCESEEDDYIVFYFQNDDAGGDVIESSSSGRRQNDVAAANRIKKHETGKRQVVEENPVPIETKIPNDYDEHKDTIEESSDSSTSSFAFPTIQREWTGSPVLMPRPEGHNKSRTVCVQCCKF